MHVGLPARRTPSVGGAGSSNRKRKSQRIEHVGARGGRAAAASGPARRMPGAPTSEQLPRRLVLLVVGAVAPAARVT
jgi:hypothetical protein